MLLASDDEHGLYVEQHLSSHFRILCPGITDARRKPERTIDPIPAGRNFPRKSSHFVAHEHM